MTESKKLQTELVSLHAVGSPSDRTVLAGRHEAVCHDARLAHEMLPVIKQLVDALEDAESWLCAYRNGDDWCLDKQLLSESLIATEMALYSAAPFLQED